MTAWRLAATVVTVLMVGVLSACSTTTSTPGIVDASHEAPHEPSVRPTPDVELPVGIIAIGHSGLTGEGTAGTFQENKAASWATGTLPDVNSIYSRLLALQPEIEGRAANRAAGGAPAAALARQADAALGLVPVPQLAIIQTVDNDIQCDAANAEAVGASLLTALEMIHDHSPNSKILVVGQAGRPSVDFVEELIAAHPSVKAELTWDDKCTFFNADGTLNPDGFTNLTAAIDAYEAEAARVCATVPNCVTDGGLRRAYVDKMENFAPDFAHFNVRGQAAMAELIWPVVEELLGL